MALLGMTVERIKGRLSLRGGQPLFAVQHEVLVHQIGDEVAAAHRLARLDADETPEGESPMEVGLAEAEAACPERTWISAIDLETWIGGLLHRDRGLMETTMAGQELTHPAPSTSSSLSPPCLGRVAPKHSRASPFAHRGFYKTASR